MPARLSRKPELKRLAERLEDDRRQLMIKALQAGINSKQFVITDLEVRIDALLGAIYLRYLILQKPINRRYVQRLVDDMLADI